MKDWPQPYSCKFIEAGIVSYEDSDAGIALLKKETIDKMAHTFIGKPVIIDHNTVTPENIEKYAVGYVTRVSFCPEDGWFYADFIICDDEAKKCIDEDGYSVSCAYNVLDVASGGLWHDIKFDGEITEGCFTHLALVKQPRYEESKITKQLPVMLVNGKSAHYVNQTEESEMFKIFKKKENEKQEDFSNLHVAINGKDVPVAEIIKSFIENKKNEKDEKKEEKRMAKDEDIVDINGNAYSIAELKAAYASKKNEKEEEKKEEEGKEEKKENEGKEEKKEEEKVKEAKKNETEEEEKKKEEENKKKNEKDEEEKEEKKENSKKGDQYFVELKNAGAKFVDDTEGTASMPLTRSERAEAWRAKTNKR